MRGRIVRASVAQVGDHNTQINNYYTEPVDPLTAQEDRLGLKPGCFEPLVGTMSGSTPQVLRNAVSEEMQRRGTSAAQSPVGDLLSCRRLAVVVAENGDWQARRAFSHALAHSFVLNEAEADMTQDVACELVERAAASPNLDVMLAIAGTASVASASALSRDPGKLYSASHPQVLWQHCRKPSLAFARHDGFRVLVDAALEREDDWVRRKLISSSLLQASQGRLMAADEMRRLLEAAPRRDAPFIQQTIDWIDPRKRSDLARVVPSGMRRSLDDVDQPVLTLEALGDAESHLVRRHLERESLSLDLRRTSELVSGSSTTDQRSKGMYSTIENTVCYILGRAEPKGRGLLIDELLNSSDEGVRWAVAAQFSSTLPARRLVDAQANQIRRLIGDRHPWVAREALSMLAEAELVLSPDHLDEVAVSIGGALTDAETRGWPRGELMPAVGKVFSSVPSLADRFVLRPAPVRVSA